jgi:molecular chaperone DnaK (HSP70)
MRPEDVDEIVLVGGSTRIPKVKEQLRYVQRERIPPIRVVMLSYNTHINLSHQTIN